MKNIVMTLMCVGLLSLAVGCEQQQRTGALDDSLRGGSSYQEPITVDTVVDDMSPELAMRAETSDESRITVARTIDTNTRSIWDDLRNIFLLDRPSRLSLYPTP